VVKTLDSMLPGLMVFFPLLMPVNGWQQGVVSQYCGASSIESSSWISMTHSHHDSTLTAKPVN